MGAGARVVAGGSFPHYSDRSRRIAASFLKRHCASESGTEPVAQWGLRFLERGPGCGPAHSPQPCVPGGDTESPGGGADRPGDDAEPRHVCSSTRPGAAAAARDVFPRVTHAAGRLQTPRPLHPARPRRRVREERQANVSHSQPRASAGLLATSPRGSSPAASLLRPQGPCTPPPSTAVRRVTGPGSAGRVRPSSTAPPCTAVDAPCASARRSFRGARAHPQVPEPALLVPPHHRGNRTTQRAHQGPRTPGHVAKVRPLRVPSSTALLASLSGRTGGSLAEREAEAHVPTAGLRTGLENRDTLPEPRPAAPEAGSRPTPLPSSRRGSHVRHRHRGRAGRRALSSPPPGNGPPRGLKPSHPRRSLL